MTHDQGPGGRTAAGPTAGADLSVLAGADDIDIDDVESSLSKSRCRATIDSNLDSMLR